jgi:tetratricopeptide (TPR) repeat protein
MPDIKNILEKAHSYFIGKEYNKAILLYSQALSFEPDNREYTLYCVFCDIAYTDEFKAQNLFDYFIISRNVNLEDAIKSLEDIIEAYDGNNDKMMEFMKDVSIINVEKLDAIDYMDFRKLVDIRGSFKEAYQDIMFSLKVALKTKEDFVNFVNQLIDNDFEKSAYHYLDGFNQFFIYDNQDITKLYNKLGKKDIDIR